MGDIKAPSGGAFYIQRKWAGRAAFASPGSPAKGRALRHTPAHSGTLRCTPAHSDFMKCRECLIARGSQAKILDSWRRHRDPIHPRSFAEHEERAVDFTKYPDYRASLVNHAGPDRPAHRVHRPAARPGRDDRARGQGLMLLIMI